MIYTPQEVESWDTTFAADVYRQASSIIDHISKNIEIIREEWRYDIIKSLNELVEKVDKAVVDTPMDGKTGKIKWDSVGHGNSIWVVAKHGPHAGGHILVTKRHDGMAVQERKVERTKETYTKHKTAILMTSEEKQKRDENREKEAKEKEKAAVKEKEAKATKAKSKTTKKSFRINPIKLFKYSDE